MQNMTMQEAQEAVRTEAWLAVARMLTEGADAKQGVRLSILDGGRVARTRRPKRYRSGGRVTATQTLESKPLARA